MWLSCSVSQLAKLSEGSRLPIPNLGNARILWEYSSIRIQVRRSGSH